MSASSHRWASPFHTDELVDWAHTEVAVHRYGRFGRHRGTRLVHRNSMTGECTTVRGESGTMMRHILPARGVAASLAVAALALGMTMPTASGLLVPASCCAQRIASGEAATVRSAVLLSAITARADEHLTSASGTWKASGIVHRPSSIVRPGGVRLPPSRVREQRVKGPARDGFGRTVDASPARSKTREVISALSAEIATLSSAQSDSC